MSKREVVVFAGATFYRYPQSSGSASRYFQDGAGRSLHRVMWETVYGPIPPAHHVHHKDGNHSNNEITNLECIPAFDHLSSHARSRRTLKVCAFCRKEYETTHAGRGGRFCSNPCKSAWRRKEKLDNEWRKCVECGVKFFVSRFKNTLNCSRSCGATYRNRLARLDKQTDIA